jgi:hypothetical protein
VGLVTELLARLVELRLDGGRRGLVLERQSQKCQARPRETLDPVIPAQFLEALFQRFGDQVLHLFGRGARPDRRHRQHLDGESRILGAAELQEGKGSGRADRDQQKQRDRAFPDRKRREIEPAQGRLA